MPGSGHAGSSTGLGRTQRRTVLSTATFRRTPGVLPISTPWLNSVHRLHGCDLLRNSEPGCWQFAHAASADVCFDRRVSELGSPIGRPDWFPLIPAQQYRRYGRPDSFQRGAAVQHRYGPMPAGILVRAPGPRGTARVMRFKRYSR
jgi:hypothetical protein